MIPSYSMAAVNVIVFLLLFSISLLLKKKFDRLNLYTLPFLLLYSVLPLLSIARIGTYESGDLSLNVYKTMDLWRSLQEGNIIPTWAGHLNAMYGYPLFIFTYPLPYFLNAFFHLIGFSFVSSVKMTLVTAYLFSGIVMYYFLRERFSMKSAFFGAILYLYAPYHLINMHFRVDIGEMCAIAIVPLIFLSIEKLSKKFMSPFWFTVGCASVALLILSHQAVSLTALPFTVLYVFFINASRDLKERGLRFLLMFLFGLLLSGFYVFPLLYLKEFTIQSLGVEMAFASFKDLLFSPYRYGLLFQGPSGELSFLLGYVQIILLLVGIWMFKTGQLSQIHKKLLLFVFFGIGTLIFFMLKMSEPLWFLIPLIKNFQFTYRLLAVIIFFFALLGAIITENTKKIFIIYILIFFTIFTTILNWGNRRVIPEIADAQLEKGVPQSTYYGEGLSPAAPKWVDPAHVWMKDPPSTPLEILSGKAKIHVIERKVHQHRYTVIVEEAVVLKENTLYFPDWTVLANQQPQKLVFTNPNYPGIITFRLPKGTHTVEVLYKNPLITTVSRHISLFVFLSLIFFNLFYYRSFFLAPFHKKR